VKRTHHEEQEQSEKQAPLCPYWPEGSTCWGHRLPWRDKHGTAVSTGWWNAERARKYLVWEHDSLASLHAILRTEHSLFVWAEVRSEEIRNKAGEIVREGQDAGRLVARARAALDFCRRKIGGASTPAEALHDLDCALALASAGLIDQPPRDLLPPSLESVADVARAKADEQDRAWEARKGPVGPRSGARP
jgi:hypothetical protein